MSSDEAFADDLGRETEISGAFRAVDSGGVAVQELVGV